MVRLWRPAAQPPAERLVQMKPPVTLADLPAWALVARVPPSWPALRPNWQAAQVGRAERAERVQPPVMQVALLV